MNNIRPRRTPTVPIRNLFFYRPYVLEGEGEVLIDGEPPRKVKAGDAFVIPMGKIHNARNTGTVPLKVLVNYVVEKGKPLVVPAQ